MRGRESNFEWIHEAADIEKRSFEIITAELGERHVSAGIAEVVKRVIHTTADFDYADSLAFSPDVIEAGQKPGTAAGATVVTDTNMALWGEQGDAGKARRSAVCLMADEQVASEAKARWVSAAAACLDGARRQI